MQVQFSAEKIQELFPFHLILSGDFKIISIGKSLNKILPELKIDSILSTELLPDYPTNDFSIKNLPTYKGVVILKSKSRNVRLKYQVFQLEGSKMLMTGHPVIDSNFDIERHGLTISDFAQHDSLVEQLFLMQATKRSLNDAASLNSELAEKNVEINRAKERYEMVVNNVHDIIFQTDNDGHWTFLNKAWEDIMEFSVNESLGKMFFSYLHPDDVQRNYELFLPLINREKTYCSHQIRYIAKSGKIKWIKVYAILTFDQNGEVSGTSGTLQDLTEQRETFEKYELLANNVTDLVSINNLDGTYVYVSPSIETFIGYKAEEILGHNGLEFLHPDEMNELIEFGKRYAASIEGSSLQHRLKTKNGNWKWVETTSRIAYSEKQKPTAIISSSRSIDERKRAEDVIVQALKNEQEINHLKSKFISLVSHEMKTPMTSIYTGVEIMEHQAKKLSLDNETFTTQFSIIKGEVERLNELIEKILFWGKSENGQVSNVRKEINVVNFVSDVSAKINRLQKDNRKVVIKITGADTNIFIDSLHLEHIITNLITNAFKYSSGRPAPECELIFSQHDFRVKVKDYGVGIPKNEMRNLFKSFFRASNVEHIKGNGIGMTIVKHFADLNNAEIKVDTVQKVKIL